MRFAITLILIGAVLFAACGTDASPFTPRDNSTITLQTDAGGIGVRVEVMDTDAEWKRGMMGRTELADGMGMLFVFPNEKIHDFWMKDTQVPLDMLFFDADLTLLHIQHNVPPCKRDPCPTFGSQVVSQYVLEVPAGWAKEHGVKLGDTLQR